ncbi:isoprenylcysteine carboxylmethyltransferase family protein [Candidatus Kuenenbacteria bacterium]|nr:isoprenylcysteine carboxylmethyltransferase family protein [Candidatus Kuenenbacteria bacterium]
MRIKELNNLGHRLLFVAIDAAGFGFLNWQLFWHPRRETGYWSWLGLVIFMSGLFFSAWARLYLGRNWDTAGTGGIKHNHQLITTGPYRISRNPIYLGTLVLFLGFETTLGSFFVFLAVPLLSLIIWEAKREEKLLEKHFGEKFEKYKSQVPFLFPRQTA